MKKIINRHPELVSGSTNRFFASLRMTGCKFGMTGTLAAILSVFMFFGCDQLQDSLSESKQEDLEEETGTLSVSSANWYYNGSSSTDVSETSGYITLKSGKQLAESSTGASVGFEISYTDANGNSTSVAKSGSGGIGTSGKTYNVDMSPVLALLTGSGNITKDNVVSAKIKVSGLICNEGDQQGRNLSSFEKTISVKPLFSTATLNGITFSTASSTTGKTFAIPLLAEVSLGSDSSLVLNGTLPSGLSTSDFAVSVSDGGDEILLSSAVDLYGQSFSAAAVITGVYLPNSEKPLTIQVPVTFSPTFNTNDTITPTNENGTNWDISSVDVSSDGTNLTLNVNFNGTPALWENNRIVIMIDDAALGSGTTTYESSQWKNAATYMSVNSSVEFYGFETPKDGVGSAGSTMTSGNTWTQGSDWAYTTSSETLTYTIPFTSITDGTNTATSSDILRIAVFVSDYWISGTVHVKDVAPASAATISTTDETNDTLSVDFDNALIYSSEGGSTPVPTAPKYFTATSVTSSTVSLAWSDGLNATSYTLSRTDAEGTSVELLTGSAGTTFDDSGLSASTTYTYSLTAVNSSGSSSAKPLEVTTSAPVPESFTVTPAFTFNPDGTDVTVSWTESANADAYKVQYKKSTDDDYVVSVESTTEKSATLSGLAMGTYNIEVIASNKSGSLESTCDAKIYPTITLDGTMSESEYWTNTDVASVSTDSGYTNADTENSKISGLYITNDAEYLYIAVDFGSDVPRLLSKQSHIGFIIGDSSSTETTVSASWGTVGIATTTTLSNGGAVYSFADQTLEKWASDSPFSAVYPTDVESNNQWTYEWTTVNTWKGSSTVCEYKVPLSKVNKASGDTIYLVAGTSDYDWDTASASNWIVKDVVPWSSATISGTTAINNINLAVDLSKALTYTIK